MKNNGHVNVTAQIHKKSKIEKKRRETLNTGEAFRFQEAKQQIGEREREI